MSQSNWKEAVEEEWKRREKLRNEQPAPWEFPLNQQTYDSQEIIAMIDCLIDGRLSMANRVDQFEKVFGEKVGEKFTVYCNSGSSANLLAVACACCAERTEKNGYLKPGDEVIVPALCWSTSVFPLLQYGLKPVFVDVNPLTLNTTLENIKKATTPKTRAIFMVHVMGNVGCDEGMEELLKYAKTQNWIVFEDTCESFLSRWDGKVLGGFGDFGMYSFYFSHHLCTGEGGMVICKNQRDHDLLRSIRAHGWTRLHSKDFKKEEEKNYPDIDNRFLFAHMGYNLRPMEIQAAMGLEQMKKIDEMNACRVKSYYLFIEKIKKHPKYADQFDFITKFSDKCEPIWFGLPCLLKEKFQSKRNEFLEHLTKHKIENRPVLTGNFCRQPAIKKHPLCKEQAEHPEKLSGADRVHFCGFYIGTCSVFVDETGIDKIVNIIMDFF